MLPLAGIKVLSAAQLLPGGYCTKLLADLGADIVMLERLEGGDPMRLMPDMFSMIAMGKRSITVNLGTEQGRRVCYKIVERSHIFVESFRPGVARKLKIDYETLKGINPRIIYASISGFGQDGPYSDKPGHDIIYQGITGMLAGLIPKDGGKFVPPQVAVGDWSSGMFAALSILGALYSVRETGHGQYIDISMTDGLVSWMGRRLAPDRQLSFQIQPTYSLYRTREGKFLALGIGTEQHFWRNLCKAIRREDLSELSGAERAEREEELFALFEELFETKTRDEWIQILTSAEVPHGPVYDSPEEVLGDPQLRYRGMVTEVDDPEKGRITRIGSPLRLSGMETTSNGRAPELGEHTQEILLSLGYKEAAIESMKEEGII
jgi:crotonobetainyl-CoA:carnitine CoA-transferase CaiB-like acyl-CoA transferase